ncbi:MAG TPA: UDP-N-acetylmuramate dehydrogenase [Bacteroidia bacterium]|jgi:UDP-N-acetylmuramate dehydrogenase|nr:UDP-N-acetylmuramate dehydrogenase [Bacteroidia bacterium]
MKLHENYPLQELTTFHAKVSAKYFTEFNSAAELKEILSSPQIKDKPYMILGGGSNVLFTGDYNGIIIRNAIKGFSIIGEDQESVYIRANAGEKWHDFVMYCVNNNYGGIENLSLIPGTVGAGPIQNIGAYGVELKDVLHEVEAMHVKTFELRKFTNAECKFGYRESVFKHEEKGNYIILSVTFRLVKNSGKVNVSYGSLNKELEDAGITNPTIKDVSNTVIKIRSSKLPDPAKIGNAGSFFKNPIIDNSLFDKIKSQYSDIAFFPAHQGHTKLAAGWLIEHCGWKGKRIGDAGVHKDQALVLVNYGNATGKEIYDLSTQVIASVKEKFGVELEREVNMI